VIHEQPRTAQHSSPYQPSIARIKKEDESYQLLTVVYLHESTKVVEDLHPTLGYILSRNVVTHFKPHERLAQQYRCAQTTFCCFYADRGNDQRFEQRAEHTLEYFWNVGTGYNHKRPEDCAGKRGKRSMSDLG
jgi:hypothetical protein